MLEKRHFFGGFYVPKWGRRPNGGTSFEHENEPEGRVWVPESYEHEVRVAGGSGHGQNLVFLSFQGHNVDFFDISRRSVYVLVRSLRSLSRWWCCAFFKEISVFFGFWYFFFIFRVFLCHFGPCGFFFMKKRLFLVILSDLGIFSHLWLFNMNGRLFITKKDCFWSFY